ncbi:hypothetical protein Scep_004657 [Stephania cephalantha]|uniref:Uncharacterized protein n=1 Tax=Stephania cephalantha TaxID=152367 RepID=A0AAP0KSU7_9MAGN
MTRRAQACGASDDGAGSNAAAARECGGGAGTAWSNDAVARCRTDRSPTRQQWWTRRRDFDEARRRDGFRWTQMDFGVETSIEGYVARVRAGRQVSRPEPESAGLLPRLNDLLAQQSQEQSHAVVASGPTTTHRNLIVDGVFFARRSRRSPTRHGRAQLVAEEPNPTEWWFAGDARARAKEETDAQGRSRTSDSSSDGESAARTEVPDAAAD